MTHPLQHTRERLKNGEVFIGIFCKTTAPEFIEVIGHAGFDFCILDMEHGPANLETLQNLIRAAEVSGVLPIVRTRDMCPESIAQPLDLGAAGVQVPQVASRAEAEAVVDAAVGQDLGLDGFPVRRIASQIPVVVVGAVPGPEG